MKKKKVCILGSTGSVGRNTLKVISDLSDRFEVSGLSAHSNIPLLARQINEFKPSVAAISDESLVRELRKRIRHHTTILAGKTAHEELAGQKDADIIMVAITGSASIRPAYSAVSHGKDVALASKEALVSAGHLIMREAKRRNSAIIPVDSEHSAIFQCLMGNNAAVVRKLYITSSGGPLWNVPKKAFKNLSQKKVLRHPKWKMGKKISVDSATMMNKGLEVIEAKWFFGMNIDSIEVLIHPEAVIHSMVEFIDGVLLAQLSITDMRIPIQYALSYPERCENRLKRLDLADIGRLSFCKPDKVKFPALEIAYEAAKAGGSAPSVLNASNEAAVRAFLVGKIDFTAIPVIIEKVLAKHKRIEFPSLDEIDAIGRWAEREVGRFC
ncbi:MAG: 1-deoxy-D-xylulose-5-phosphate reductoisomerase [Candidatus Omnitrophica bacterium]|nr:1-deoxy-D-xylulose-5-phosphate reductoisomerase [Candidatus Omnitrophota bacterium]MBU4488479.1 1-deoxy-D-xylulose-5-phosphate reductoisomerase [Candidatus Omnitrophota bacterium]